jgi:hypothetical protein
MDQRDQLLLDKQFRWLRPTSPNLGVVALTMLTVFVGGIFFGGAVYPAERNPVQPLGASTAETGGASSLATIMIAGQNTSF